MRNRSTMLRWQIAVGVALLSASVVSAAPAKLPRSHKVQRFLGSVYVHSSRGSTIVAFSQGHSRQVDTLFTAEQGPAGPSVSFRSESAEILLWEGHLVVMAPDLRRALHVSIPGFTGKVELREPGASAISLDPLRLDTQLTEAYDLTVMDSAYEIVSRSATWKAPLEIDDEAAQERLLTQERGGLRRHASAINTVPYNKDLGGGSGGDGTSSCNFTCPDGSSCSASCPAGTGGNTTQVAKCVCNPTAHCGCG